MYVKLYSVQKIIFFDNTFVNKNLISCFLFTVYVYSTNS